MAWTKLQIIEAAYEELGLGGYVFDLESDQLQKAVVRLDSLAAFMERKGGLGGYVFAADPSTADSSTEIEISHLAFEALYSNLAIRLAPTVGKQPMPETKQLAKDSMRSLIGTVEPPKHQMKRGVPIGAGNRVLGTDQEFFPGYEATNPSESNQILDD